MNKKVLRWVFFFLFTIIAWCFYNVLYEEGNQAGLFSQFHKRALAEQSLLFVGDVMLGRKVETWIDERGFDYPYASVKEYLHSHTYVFGNFEASLPKVHTQTPSMTFKFSIDPAFIPALKENGFTDMTLANNHAYDYGVEGYTNAVHVLKEAGIGVHGSPQGITSSDIAYIELGDKRVAVLPLYAVYETPSSETLAKMIAEAEKNSDFQIVSIHWGEEYVETNTKRQQNLAHLLIDRGVDAVVGHHPHVIENIEVYKGAPIFYSLGNFVFDQYWDEEVKKGLTVAFSPQEKGMKYTLTPVYIEEGAPKIMEGEMRETTLHALSATSDPLLKNDIEKGVFSLAFPVLH